MRKIYPPMGDGAEDAFALAMEDLYDNWTERTEGTSLPSNSIRPASDHASFWKALPVGTVKRMHHHRSLITNANKELERRGICLIEFMSVYEINRWFGSIDSSKKEASNDR